MTQGDVSMRTQALARISGISAMLLALSATLACLDGSDFIIDLDPVPPGELEDEIDDSFNNTPPRADAGDDQVVRPGETVVLSAAESTDAEADRLSFSWSVYDPDQTIDIEILPNPNNSIVRFVAPVDLEVETQFRFTVLVRDRFSSATDDVVVTVVPE
jgi:hypothetical protein